MWFKSIQLEAVTYEIRNRMVLEPQNFNIVQGDYIWLRGGPGLAKSTLMKIICSLLSPTSGKVLINSKNLQEFSAAELHDYRLRLGYLFEMGGLLQSMTVKENLLLPLLYHKICSEKEAEERVEYWLKKFKLSHVAKQKPFVLSGSQRKATCALRAMIHEPELLLFDEPLAGLNDDHMIVLFDWIKELQQQNKLFTVMVASDRSVEGFFKSNQEWAAA